MRVKATLRVALRASLDPHSRPSTSGSVLRLPPEFYALQVLVAMGNGANLRMIRASIHMQECEGDELKESETLHRSFYLRLCEILTWWN